MRSDRELERVVEALGDGLHLMSVAGTGESAVVGSGEGKGALSGEGYLPGFSLKSGSRARVARLTVRINEREAPTRRRTVPMRLRR